MVFKSPSVVEETVLSSQRSTPVGDLSSIATASTGTCVGAQHSLKKSANEVQSNLVSNCLLQNKSDDNDKSVMNKNEMKSAVLEKNNITFTNIDAGQCTPHLMQTGIDRYITVQPKRKRSPRAALNTSVNKFSRLASVELAHGNRFSSLVETEYIEDATSVDKPKNEKPPPIYLREESNKELVKSIETITEGNYYISSLKRGNIKETKIQPLNIDAYRALIKYFDQVGKRYYTYQLKSQKGLVVIIKGIESFVEPNEIHDALTAEGFNAKSITNIINREKIPQPLFRLELEPDNKPMKGKHAIYSIKYLLHRRVTVEEPKKRIGPLQCIKCQEYGHSKAYCTLNDVCVICGELHNSKQCNKRKTDASVLKCSNCNGNHTANFRGCPIYMELKRRINPKQRPEQRMLNLHPSVKPDGRPEVSFANFPNITHNATVNSTMHQGVSYASILKGNAPKTQVTEERNITTALNKLTDMMQSFMTMMERTMDLMMQNMNVLMQIVAKK